MQLNKFINLYFKYIFSIKWIWSALPEMYFGLMYFFPIPASNNDILYYSKQIWSLCLPDPP